MRLFGVPYLIRNRVVEFEPGRRIAWRHFTANRWRYELTPTADGGTRVTETFDLSRADRVTTAVVRAAKFPERNREGIIGTLRAPQEGGRGRRRDLVLRTTRQIRSRRGRTGAGSRGPAAGRRRRRRRPRRRCRGGPSGPSSSASSWLPDERLRVVLAQVEVAQLGQVVAEGLVDLRRGRR